MKPWWATSSRTSTGQTTGAIRWFELRKAGANPWALYQEGHLLA